MKTVAFIPARGGSSGIKMKNIMPVKEKPLIFWVLKSCVESALVDKIFVSTDCDEIKSVVNSFGFPNVEVIGRSEASASDEAPSESALLEFCNAYEFENVIFMQATSPLTTALDIDGALGKFGEYGADSLLSVVRRHQFLWSTSGHPLNYDPLNRPRRQDWDGYLIENGAFYVSTRTNVINSGCRVSGKIVFWEMEPKSLFEVDNDEDRLIIENLL